jgi:subtilisin family serine protease
VSAIVFREATVSGTDASDIAARLQREKRAMRPGQRPQIDITSIRPLRVRIEGSARATARALASIGTVPGARVYRERLGLAPGADNVYPDARVLAAIDPEGKLRSITKGALARVAVLDSGVTLDHPDLKPYLDLLDSPAKTVDQDGHGTMLAGTILGVTNRVRNVRLLPVRFFDARQEPDADTAAEAIARALRYDPRPDIINLSFDLGMGSPLLERRIKEACERDVLVVISAGNTGSNNDQYPCVPAFYAQDEACRGNAIVVMATDWSDEKPVFSNFGATTVDVAAPGVKILTTRAFWTPDDLYRPYTGTSPAAAIVSGAAALLKSQRPELTGAQLKRALFDTVDVRPSLKCESGGRLNLSRALAYKP